MGNLNFDMSSVLLKTGGTLLLFALGYAGYLTAKRLRWPAPALLGSMALLALVNIVGVKIPCFGTPISFVAKVLSGVIIGQKINRGTVSVMRRMIRPISVASAWMVAASLITGFLLAKIAGGRLSLMTSLACSGAAGIAEMSIFALSVDADVGMVAFFQSMRIIVAYSTLPFVAAWLDRHGGHNAEPVRNVQTVQEQHEKQSLFELIRFTAITCGVAALFKYWNVPSPYMIGAMVGSSAVNLSTGKVTVCPPKLRLLAQIGIGMMVCVYLSPDTVRMVMRLFLPLVFSTGLVQLFSFALALVVRSMTGWDIITCVLATCPGGVSQVIFLAEDMNADGLTVGIFHTVRMISVIICIPIAARVFMAFM